MKTFAIGDIHGNYKGLLQCLERSGFDKGNDTLISLGDICDGFSYVCECVEELLTIKNLIAVTGNHDQWFINWINFGVHPVKWLQGGLGTAESYARNAERPIHIVPELGGWKVPLTTIDIPKTHRDFFNKQLLYYIDDKNRMFVHAGFDRHYSIQETKLEHPSDFYWDRELWKQAMSCKSEQKLATVDNFYEIFIGHTTTQCWNKTTPMKSGGVWNIDTGAGFSGKMTIINVDTYEYFQSDLCSELYPDEKGR